MKPRPRETNADPDDGLALDMLAPRFWPEVRRGGERLIRELADGLISRGLRPRLVTSQRGRASLTVEDGLPVKRVRRPPQWPLSAAGAEPWLSHLPLTYASLLRRPAQLAHAFAPGEGAVAAHWSSRHGRPSVFTHLGIPDRTYLHGQRLRARLMRRAVRCSAVVAISEAAARAMRETLGVEPVVIHPPVDLDLFVPGGERAREPTLLCAAALDDPMKRADVLMRAFELVRASHPGARLIVDRPTDPQLARQLGHAGAETVDLSSNGALVEANRTAWVAVLPSTGEAFGLVLAEALACGTPVVGTAAGGIPEVLGDAPVGRLFDADNPESLARALLEALELRGDPATTQACRGRAERFSVDRCADAHVELYGRLLERQA